MKTLYLTAGSSNIWVDTENNTTGVLKREESYYINDIFFIEEPMNVVYEYAGVREEGTLKKGDILVKFAHNDRIKNKLCVVKSKDMVENFKFIRDIEQKAKEEWAKKCQELDANTPCEDCASC